MAICPRLRWLLEESHAPHAVLEHRRAFTAQETADSAHVSGKRLAKVVVVRDESGQDLMVALPAPMHVERESLRRLTGRKGIRIEEEAELARLFPDCELGAMPPFGELYGLTLYLDPCLRLGEDIYFQGGTHETLVRMRVEDYVEVARPMVPDFCLHDVKELAAVR
jgi:Ala-tRNA(Pro) deacylase